MQPASHTKSPTGPRNAVASILREQKIGAVDVWGNFSRRDDGTNATGGVGTTKGFPLIARLRGCAVARLRGCAVARLRGCAVARLRGCAVARLRGCAVARLRGCAVARLRGCAVARLRKFFPKFSYGFRDELN